MGGGGEGQSTLHVCGILWYDCADRMYEVLTCMHYILI